MEMVKDFTKTKWLIKILFVLVMVFICVGSAYASDEPINNIDNSVNKINDSTLKLLNATKYVEPNNSIQIIPLKKSNIIYIHKHKSKKRIKNSKKKHKKISTITIISKPSCGCRNSYKWHKKTFVNYCPNCHNKKCLTNKHKIQAKYEQELTCKICDCDFCGVCGKQKYSWSRMYLQRA